MVFESILQDKAIAGWCRAVGEPFLTADTKTFLYSRLISFVDLGFLWKLLGYYGVNLFHLHPNNILHISLFINLCEAFIGIAPHFNLFRYFFCLKPFLGFGSPKVVGGVYLQLRDAMMKECIQVPLNTSLK